MLCGGVGGARMARALSGSVAADRLTVVVNVGDDDSIYGVHVAADLDTVLYTMAGIEGPRGWGIAGDTFNVMEELSARGVDTSFRLGDRDLATCLRRTEALHGGATLGDVTAELTTAIGVESRILPATNDHLRTLIQIESGSWIPFQEYFVRRGHQDPVVDIEYHGASSSHPTPGVIAAIEDADLVVIAPSNPPLSIWPILAVPGIKGAVAATGSVVAVSPLFKGKALKGPADRVMTSLGLPPGTAGVLQAYEGLLNTLIVDEGDSDDERLSTPQTKVIAADTRITDAKASRRFGSWLMDTMFQ